MAQRAGQILVQREILKHEADRMHLQVSDEDLIRELKTGPFAQYLFPNGTYIGGAGEPLPTTPVAPGHRVELADDDRVYVGAWTRIVVRQA